ncbi:rod shape-determining protein RodA [Polymorphobacter fuscus]|uniref:Peptidoglycan glycosyltransferase MrdB n=1 Tax=Sandarakinorhabdus fusca TaxID=1439888 RepID=A0A7C9GRN3_9SPHN|nr:rod shape-determining protein RodA [Polymorphobacter fuscus]KAB7643907.1 rod shape-determining protein RodA [Polymorphobacter fuscus]MQT18610.1 rod shape-determining protein RodA [Polymorphobacter fuscus]NJC07022.1 rod shape determining protein RodA [Polymorphobacter fuscus]
MFNGPWLRELGRLPWGVILVIVALGSFGLVVLYSAAGGALMPWASKQGIRFAILLMAMLGLAMVRPETWMRLAWPIYGVVLLGLIGVELLGHVGGGSQRWLDIGIIRLQPSEFMKLAIVLVLARYYQSLPTGFETRLNALLPALGLIAVPAALVMLQPDLGTALSITFGGVVVMFLAGVRLWLFVGAGVAAAAAMPLVWVMLHEYQRKRVLIFIDPSTDPRGAGYHITQSKIAIGSGGLHGKGFLNGTQSHLDYLPELQTDFIFATMAEEWGLMGGLFIILGFGIVLAWGIGVALRGKTQFERLLALGLTSTLFFYLAVNMMMVMGLAPVVGIPLPLISYGGSAMMTVLILLGIVMGIARKNTIPKQ